jgi:hypothetical protein
MNRLARYTISGLRRTLDLQGRATLPEYGFLVLGSSILALPTIMLWVLLDCLSWPFLFMNAWTLLACTSAGIRRLRDARQHVGWAIAHGVSMLMIVAAYGLLLADIEIPRPEMRPGLSGVIAFVLVLIFTVASVALLQVVMLAPIAIFLITTPVMAYLVRQPTGPRDLPSAHPFGWLPWKL